MIGKASEGCGIVHFIILAVIGGLWQLGLLPLFVPPLIHLSKENPQYLLPILP